MALKRKNFPSARDSRKPTAAIVRLATFCEAQTLEEAAFAANEINSRKRRDRKEFKEARKKTRLAALLPRWCPNESAGE
jgi:hypothetical protein